MKLLSRFKEAIVGKTGVPEPSSELLSWAMYGKTKRAIFSLPEGSTWYAETIDPMNISQETKPWRWKIQQEISMADVHAQYDAATMTLADRNGSGYEENSDLLRMDRWLFAKTKSSEVILREIQTCEVLRGQPHPNIYLYRGKTINDNGLVMPLVFDRYDTTLFDLVKGGKQFDGANCIRDVEAGLTRLHSLAFIHFDLKPDNIFYSARDKRFCLGNFDTAHQIGMRLSLKRGAKGWHPKNVTKGDVATPEIDWYGFEVLKFWIKMKGNGSVRQGDTFLNTGEILEIAAMIYMRVRSLR